MPYMSVKSRLFLKNSHNARMHQKPDKNDNTFEKTSRKDGDR